MVEDVIYIELCKPVGVPDTCRRVGLEGVVDGGCKGPHRSDALWRNRDGENKSEDKLCLRTLLCENLGSEIWFEVYYEANGFTPVCTKPR